MPPAEWEVGKRIFARTPCRSGLMIRPMGHLVVLSPPLIITKAQVDQAVAALRKAIQATTDDLVKEGLLQP